MCTKKNGTENDARTVFAHVHTKEEDTVRRVQVPAQRQRRAVQLHAAGLQPESSALIQLQSVLSHRAVNKEQKQMLARSPLPDLILVKIQGLCDLF